MKFQIVEDQLRRRLREVKLVLSDVDGCLSRGICFNDDGTGFQLFSEKDFGKIEAVKNMGVPFVMISGRYTGAAKKRAENMRVHFLSRKEVNENLPVGGDPLTFIENSYKVSRKEILYIGDDWPDLWWMSRVLISAAPADAEEKVLARADMIASRRGGEGAVADILTYFLDANGRLERIISGSYNLSPCEKNIKWTRRKER